MQTKKLVTILMVTILVTTFIYTSYHLGNISGFETGKKLYASSDSLSRTGLFMTNKTSFEAGYQAGLHDAQNGITPTP